MGGLFARPLDRKALVCRVKSYAGEPMNRYDAYQFLSMRRRQRLERRRTEPQPYSFMFSDPVLVVDVATYREIVVKVGDDE